MVLKAIFFVNYPIKVSDDLTGYPHNCWCITIIMVQDTADGRNTTAYEPSVMFGYKGLTASVAVMANDHGFW